MERTHRNLSRAGGIAAILGGALWVAQAALRATSTSEFDTSFEAIGLVSTVLIATGFVALYVRQPRRTRELALTGLILGLAGVSVVGIEIFVPRDLWQLRFLGELAFISGSVLLGIAALKANTLAGWRAWALIVCSVALLSANSQGWGVWMWAPFGLGWVIAGQALAWGTPESSSRLEVPADARGKAWLD